MTWRGMATTVVMIGRLFLTICAGLVDSSHAVECSTCSMVESSSASQDFSCVSIESLSREVASREIWCVPRGCSMRGPMICKTQPEINHCETEVPDGLSETQPNKGIHCETEVPDGLSETQPNKGIHCETEVPDGLSQTQPNKSIHFERRGWLRDYTAYPNNNNQIETGSCYIRGLITHFDYNHCDTRGRYVEGFTSYLVSVVHTGAMSHYSGEVSSVP